MDKLIFTILLHELAGMLKRQHNLFGYAASYFSTSHNAETSMCNCRVVTCHKQYEVYFKLLER